ncbi:MAG: hypothetical protein K9M82_10520 [Deltaproteobacteria bacterium]|nr:hypothetical protein [Deltaproteobacteria bacterium]
MTKHSGEIEWRGVRFVPILHNRLEFALEVQRQFEAFRPDCVAVEYPPTLRRVVLEGVERLPYLSAIHYTEEDGTFVYLLVEPTDGQVEAVRLALARGLPVFFVDRDTEGYPLNLTPMPDPYALTRIGHAAYCRAYLRIHRNDERSERDELRERAMAYHLRTLNAQGRRVLFVGGLYHLPGVLDFVERAQAEPIGKRKREGVGLAHLHEESSREVMTEMPFLAGRYEAGRTSVSGQGLDLDRLELHQDLIRTARDRYWKNSKERLSRNQVRVLNRFARNYALVTGGLAPDFYQLVVAARGAADDNFAYEVWEKGSEYPWQTEAPGIPVLRLRGEDPLLDQRRIRFHRRLKTFRRRLVPVPGRRKGSKREREEWKRDFQGVQICSYPPEDVVIEGYGARLMKKALEIKTEESARVVPFTASMLDGLDIRETLRDWHRGTLYVREERPVRGRVGSVVVIFDPDPAGREGDEGFPWRVTWLGEHSQESDMAFYSTPAGEVMEGPGISRCQYGGFMLTYPPLRVYDIWRDPFFDVARNKPERLLMAALDYSLEKNVVYVAADPPSGWCRSLAARLGKRILYLPIGVFSPVALRRIRQFHVLDGHHVRRYARKYIGR